MSIRTFASRRTVVSTANFQAEMEESERCQAGGATSTRRRNRCRRSQLLRSSLRSPISPRRPFVSISDEVWQDILSFPSPRLVPRQFSVDLLRWICIVLLDCVPVWSPMEACCCIRGATADSSPGKSRNRKLGKIHCTGEGVYQEQCSRRNSSPIAPTRHVAE